MDSCEKLGFVETLSFQQNGKTSIYGGYSACPPEPPLRFAIVAYYLLWSYCSRGCHSGGGRGITCRRPKKSVKKNILRISYENRTIPVISGSGNPPVAMTCAPPKRDAPAALQLPENSDPGSQEPVTDGCSTFTIFHGLGANHSRSCPFLLNRNLFILYAQSVR